MKSTVFYYELQGEFTVSGIAVSRGSNLVQSYALSLLLVRKGGWKSQTNVVPKKKNSEYIRIRRRSEGKIPRTLLWFSLFKILYQIIKNPAFPVSLGQIMRSAEAKVVTHSFCYATGSGLCHFCSHDSQLQYPSFPLSSSGFYPILQESVKWYTFQASCLDLFYVKATFSFPERTKYLICAFLMAFYSCN